MRTAPTSANDSACTRERSDGCLRCVFCLCTCAPREMPFAWRAAADIEAAADKLRAPDFVVARRRGHFLQVREKVFDYQGRFRRAHELRG